MKKYIYNPLSQIIPKICLAVCVIIPFLRPLAAKVQSFNVGIIIPLSGDLADYGTSIRNGFQTALADNPEKFRRIKFIYEDSRYDGKTAIGALQKLRASNIIDVYYLWGVSPTEALIPVTEANKLPVIAETTVKEATANAQYAVRAARTGEMIANALVNEIVKRKFKKVAFINAEITFYNDILKHIGVLLQKNGVEISRIERIQPNEADLKPLILRVAKQKPDVIGAFLLPPQLISFYQQAEQLNISIPAFNADILGSDSIIKAAPNNINGTFLSQVGVTTQFRNTYKEKFNNDTHIGQAAQAYDVAMLIGDLFGQLNKKLTNEEIIKAIAGTKPREGATGSFQYSESADGGKELKMPVVITEIRNKEIVNIGGKDGL